MTQRDSDNPAGPHEKWLLHLHQVVRRAGTRHVVVVAGEPAMGRDLVASFMRNQSGDPRWVGVTGPDDLRCVSGRRPSQLLGDECDVLAADLYDGPSLNTLAATMGVVRRGGLLLLLAPRPAHWGRQLQLDAGRLLSHGQRLPDFGGRLPGRLADVLTGDPAVTVLDVGEPPPALPTINPVRQTAEVDPPYRSVDQQTAVAAVARVAGGHPRRPLLLSADRGRGKSAALGIAAARLMAERGSRIIVTGPGRRAVDVVFRHASASLSDTSGERDSLHHGDGVLRYIPAWQLAQQRPDVDLVLVDEAAALPVELLETLQERYPRIVFSTTVQGYEGSGQGFALRFAGVLKKRCPQTRTLQLHQPVRWAPDDPVEPLFFRALLMDAAPAGTETVANASVDSVRLRVLDRDELAASEAGLREVYGLLIQAHYQTRPSDLYQLLDAPDVHLLVLCHDEHVVAVALVGLEGGFEPSLACAVNAGKRRPRGHLLAQSLEAHAGIAGAASLRQARVLRIAVHPALTRRGLGRRLLREVVREAGRLDCDLVGASFGATPDLIGFWRGCGFHRLWLGNRRDAASGAYAAVMTRALTAGGRAVVRRGRDRFRRGLPYLLRDIHCALAPAVALAMLAGLQPGAFARLDARDREEARRFGLYNVPLSAVLPTLYETALAALMDTSGSTCLTPAQREVLLRRLLQGQAGEIVCRATGLAGQRELDNQLRHIFSRLGGEEPVSTEHDSKPR